MNVLISFSIPQLQRAVSIKEEIAKLEQELSALAGTSAPAPAPALARQKFTMSAAAKARISAAAKARWAKLKAAK